MTGDGTQWVRPGWRRRGSSGRLAGVYDEGEPTGAGGVMPLRLIGQPVDDRAEPSRAGSPELPERADVAAAVAAAATTDPLVAAPGEGMAGWRARGGALLRA